jgi:DNA-binding MarR family transcriptional regulator
VLSALPVIMRTVGRSMRESGSEISPQQHRILTMLTRKPRTLSEIARIQGVRPATATTMVTTLEHRGFVRRDADPDDRRRVVVSMTEVGHTAFDAAQEVAERALAELLAPLGPEELASLAKGSDAVRRLGSSESTTRP